MMYENYEVMYGYAEDPKDNWISMGVTYSRTDAERDAERKRQELKRDKDYDRLVIIKTNRYYTHR